MWRSSTAAHHRLAGDGDVADLYRATAAALLKEMGLE